MKKELLIAAAMLAAAPAWAANYGAAMPAGEIRDIASISDDAAAAGLAGKFSGRITQVCQKEGCWLVLESDGKFARVKTKDHAFVVPKDSTGRATVHGVLQPVVLGDKEAKHLAEDGAGAAVTRQEWQIVADAIEITD